MGAAESSMMTHEMQDGNVDVGEGGGWTEDEDEQEDEDVDQDALFLPSLMQPGANALGGGNGALLHFITLFGAQNRIDALEGPATNDELAAIERALSTESSLPIRSMLALGRLYVFGSGILLLPFVSKIITV